jgi:hypothetical protein
MTKEEFTVITKALSDQYRVNIMAKIAMIIDNLFILLSRVVNSENVQ